MHADQQYIVLDRGISGGFGVPPVVSKLARPHRACSKRPPLSRHVPAVPRAVPLSATQPCCRSFVARRLRPLAHQHGVGRCRQCPWCLPPLERTPFLWSPAASGQPRHDRVVVRRHREMRQSAHSGFATTGPRALPPTRKTSYCCHSRGALVVDGYASRTTRAWKCAWRSPGAALPAQRTRCRWLIGRRPRCRAAMRSPAHRRGRHGAGQGAWHALAGPRALDHRVQRERSSPPNDPCTQPRWGALIQHSPRHAQLRPRHSLHLPRQHGPS